MAGVIAPYARQRADLLLGYPDAPGSFLLTQLSGTTTNTPTYTDASMGTPLANPIQSDSAGLFPAIFLNPAITYRFTLTDSIGGPLWGPVDGITVADQTTVSAAVTAAITAAITADATIGVSTLAVTGNQVLLPIPAGTGNLIIRMNNPTLTTIQGIQAGLNGQSLEIIAVGAGQVDCTYNDAAAAVGNKIVTIVTMGRTSLAPGSGGSLIMEYDGSIWRVITHEQGGAIVPAFVAGNFLGNGAMTWTVVLGNVLACSYYLTGRLLTVNFSISGTTVGGTPNTQLTIGNGAWGGYSSRDNTYVSVPVATDNGAVAVAYAFLLASGTQIGIVKTTPANWTAGSNIVNFSHTFPVL
jgi:hypothetical protein